MTKSKVYTIRFSHQAKKDIQKLTPKLKQKCQDVLENVIAISPYEDKSLIGDLEGKYSVRLTFQDRILYSIDETNKVVYIYRARTHYGQ